MTINFFNAIQLIEIKDNGGKVPRNDAKMKYKRRKVVHVCFALLCVPIAIGIAWNQSLVTF